MMNLLLDLSLHLKIAGGGLIVLAFAHFGIARHLNWRQDFASVSLVNRQIFYVHCFFLMLTLILMGLLSILYTGELLTPSPLARAVLVGLSAFWLVRLIFQWAVYDHSLWRGHRFNSFVHWLFSGLWLYLAAVYGIAAWRQFSF